MDVTHQCEFVLCSVDRDDAYYNVLCEVVR